MRDFDERNKTFRQRMDKHHAEFDRDFAKQKQTARIVGVIVYPIAIIGALLVLALLALAVWGLARYLGVV